ncbi:hypothetical protein QMK17_00415 [Rhodococcus sp. G-MC3]|uniref:phage shock envelope stress response protein PspM n=1 Tax=Rhodococcus sp. G-MC3 TaxID=3046209 RepID=UPI0024B9F8D9|nr:hypothetical protein [Rhodococcus sp. G-MC3]MDJ0391792.1 hypothetical protein [Rhodococcus sp. G-MC3]
MPVSESVSVVRDAAGNARRIGESAAAAVSRWNDPRQKQIRRIRRARRRGSWFGSASGVSAVSTAGLAAASAPEWTMLATGGTAAVFAIPAVFAFNRFRRLRGQPLPVERPRKTVLPSRSSAAYEPINRLVGAQQSLFELSGILARSEFVDQVELTETNDVAAAAARALTEMASDIVAMERAADANARAGAHLVTTIAGAAGELLSGVDQYEDLVAAAARLTSPGGVPSTAVDRRRAELVSATDRLDGWASALAELAEIRGRHM